jgi:hypothetical protein
MLNIRNLEMRVKVQCVFCRNYLIFLSTRNCSILHDRRCYKEQERCQFSGRTTMQYVFRYSFEILVGYQSRGYSEMQINYFEYN